MALQGQLKRIAGPVALTNTYTTNVYNNTSALIYDVIKQINVASRHECRQEFSGSDSNAPPNAVATAQDISGARCRLIGAGTVTAECVHRI